MVTFSQLNNQNHKIAELSKVLSHLIQDREICDTDTTCDLFFQYVSEVRSHLDAEDREIYQPLLVHNDQNVVNLANQFLTGSAEIKRVFNQYLKRWCTKKELRIRDHDAFLEETREMFELVENRITDEVEKLYPVVREVVGDRMAA